MAGCKPRINPEIHIGSGWQPFGEWKKTYQLSVLSRLFQSSPTNRCCHQGKSELMLIIINFIRYHKMLFISSSFKIERTYSWKYTLCLMPGHLKITRAERAKLKPKFLNEWMNEKNILGFKLCTEAEKFVQMPCSMVWHKAAVSSLWAHWSYSSLILSH